MKSDTERKRYYQEKLHKRKNRLHVHLSKDLRTKLKLKTRAILLRKGDLVRVMRGPGKGKEARVSGINTIRRKVRLEGVVVKNARGREVPIVLEPSNLLLLSLESTPERKAIFSEDAFKKKEAPKPKAEVKAVEVKADEKKADEKKAEVSDELPPSHTHKHESHGSTEHSHSHPHSQHEHKDEHTHGKAEGKEKGHEQSKAHHDHNIR